MIQGDQCGSVTIRQLLRAGTSDGNDSSGCSQQIRSQDLSDLSEPASPDSGERGADCHVMPNVRKRRKNRQKTKKGAPLMPASQEAPPKNCPKCRGHIIVEHDWHGTYGECITCGYVHEVLTSPPVDLAAEEAAQPVRQRRRGPSHAKQRL